MAEAASVNSSDVTPGRYGITDPIGSHCHWWKTFGFAAICADITFIAEALSSVADAMPTAVIRTTYVLHHIKRVGQGNIGIHSHGDLLFAFHFDEGN